MPNSLPEHGLRPANAMLQLRVPTTIPAFEQARLAVREFVAGMALAPRLVYRLELVLEETLMNLLRHAFADAGRPEPEVDLTLRVDSDAVVLHFEDEGPPFDPRQAPAPKRPLSIDEAVPGGLGLLLTRKAASQLSYERVGTRNCLTVRLDRGAAAVSTSPLTPAT